MKIIIFFGKFSVFMGVGPTAYVTDPQVIFNGTGGAAIGAVMV
jgi:hypothetical protein